MDIVSLEDFGLVDIIADVVPHIIVCLHRWFLLADWTQKNVGDFCAHYLHSLATA